MESSSRAEEKGSNSASQDGTVTHNGSAVPSAPPTDSQLKALSSGSFLIGLPSSGAHKHTCIYAAHKPPAAHVCLHVCACSPPFKPLWAFWSSPRPDGSLLPFHIMQRRSRFAKAATSSHNYKSGTQGLTAKDWGFQPFSPREADSKSSWWNTAKFSESS